MRLATSAVRFKMGGVPVVGNTATGAIVGLTAGGAALCDALQACDVSDEEVPESCAQLIEYLGMHGFLANACASEGRPGDTGTDAASMGEIARGGDAAVSAPHLVSAYLHVTNCCNLSCVGCYSLDAARNRAVDPTRTQLEHAIDVLAVLGVKRLIISGGEPFMRSDLPELTAHAKEAGIANVAILTNGLICDDAQLCALAGVTDVVSVSVDGVSSASNAPVRGAQRIDRLVDTLQRIKAAGIHAHMLPTIHARNIDDIPAYLELARRLDVTVGFSMLSGTRAVLGDLYFDDSALVHLAEVVGTHHLVLDDASLAGPRGAAGGLYACVACGAGSTNVSVAADGAVYPCHMLHVPALRLGDAFVEGAPTLAASIGSFALPPVDEMDGCQVCEHRYLCGGGCRGRSYLERARLDVRDPYCAYYQCVVAQTVERFVDTAQGR